jgi:hypothetical protein
MYRHCKKGIKGKGERMKKRKTNRNEKSTEGTAHRQRKKEE